VLLAGVAGGFGLEITRGPYLQTSTPTSIIIRWRTDEPTESLVHYGTAPTNLHSIAGELFPSTEHVVEIAGLNPNTRYYYSVGDLDEEIAWGPEYHFFTHPVPGTSKPTRIWAIGDCGTFNTGAGNQVGVRDAYYNFATGRHTDVWLALGDNAYYTGTDAEYQANFFDIYTSLFRKSTLWSTLGNHDTYSPVEGAQLPYFDIFSFPRFGEAGGVASGTEKYYSFDYANIHFVCLDSELSDRTPDGAMLSWLRSDLEANSSDWIIAYWHSPPYSKGSHDSDNLFDNFGNMTDMRANAVRLLEEYGVDLVLSGHSHIYERSHLTHGHYGFSDSLTSTMIKDSGSGKVEDTGAYIKPLTGPGANQGAVYVVAGSSGWATSRTGHHPVMYFDELEVGSMVIDINGKRLDAKFLRETGAIDDHFTIIKSDSHEGLRICTFAMNDGEVIVRWKSIAGQIYRVQHTISMENPAWTNASDEIVASGATTSWSTPFQPGETQRFFRVIQLAPPPVPVLAKSSTSPMNVTTMKDSSPRVTKRIAKRSRPLR
jgi:Calcineurin-like phosphoesterase/Purple acid Phosphatase, N-terminal domain